MRDFPEGGFLSYKMIIFNLRKKSKEKYQQEIIDIEFQNLSQKSERCTDMANCVDKHSWQKINMAGNEN